MTEGPARGIYAIVDPEASRDPDLVGIARAILEADVTVIQLRAKHMSAAEMLKAAEELLPLCRSYNAVFIVNDRLDVALACGADGVHLGQDDLPLSVARRIAGPELTIGVSTHSVEEAKAAEQGGADYIGFGAMYATGTKKNVTDPQGPERLAEVVAAVSIPVVAIGGITADKLLEVKNAGASGAAVISAIVGSDDPGEAACALVKAWRETP